MVIHLSRRELMRAACAAGVTFLAPSLFAAGTSDPTNWDRILVLVELSGGNDGLNTVVPYTDPIYYAKRPNISVAANTVLPLSADLGFNPNLDKLMPAWAANDLAVVLGVGYTNPNLSHFRGIDIWNTGSAANVQLTDGWARRLMAPATAPSDLTAHGVLLAHIDSNPLQGPGVRQLAISTPTDFISNTNGMPDAPAVTGNPALNHVLTTQHDVFSAAAEFKAKLTTPPAFTTAFRSADIAKQAQYVAQMIAAGVKVPIYKMEIGGFDNHSNQRSKHDDLLAQLGDALGTLRAALIEKNLWNKVMVMTYSEFGRRVEQNGSSGTDHGTAAPHLIMGGGVTGGLYGTQPSLSALDSRGNLQFQVDFRRMYASAATWLGFGTAAQDAAFNGHFEPLPLLA